MFELWLTFHLFRRIFFFCSFLSRDIGKAVCNQFFHSSWQGLLDIKTGDVQCLCHGFGYRAYGYTAVKQEVFNETPQPPNVTCLNVVQTLMPPLLSTGICKGKGIKQQHSVFLSLQISSPCEVPPFPPLENGDGNDLPCLISVYGTWLAPQAKAARLAKNGKSSTRGFYIPCFWERFHAQLTIAKWLSLPSSQVGGK